MKTVNEVFSYLCDGAPLSLQMDFDNSGLLVGHKEQPVDTVLLALDITNTVIDEALEAGAQLLVSHHPVIFHSLKAVTDKGEGALVLRLVENRLAAICMHTNLDITPGGVNDVLVQLLAGREGEPFDADGCGRIATMASSCPLEQFLDHCKTVLRANGLRYYDAGHAVRKLAVMGGAGGDYLEDAARMECDTYVTSDLKYHQFLRAAELGINLIDADHFCTENPVMSALQKRLSQAFPDVRFLLSQKHKQTVSFY